MFGKKDPLSRAARVLMPVAKSYERRLAELGPDARAVFWKSEEHQVLRFEILSALFDEVDQAGGLTINDFGCGYGAFFDYLAPLDVMRRSRYIGYDMSDKMIDAARARIQDPRAQFVRAIKVTEPGDYSFICGTYNMHLGANDIDWGAYIEQSLGQVWEKSHRGMAFNLLSDRYQGERYPGLHYADPDRYETLCRETFSADTQLVSDRILPDFTIFVRR